MVVGLLWIIGGIVATLATMESGRGVVFYGAVIYGIILVIRDLSSGNKE